MNEFDNGLKSCCFTGYRPSKMPVLSDVNSQGYKDFENELLMQISKLISNGCETFYTGMAMGFDIIAAEIVLLLKSVNSNSNVKLICVLPFKNSSFNFPDEWKIRYENILKKSDDIVVLSQTYFEGCYQKRNIYMVENSDCVLTCFDGKTGGTKNTLQYANKRLRHIINIHNNTADFAVQTKIKF